MRNNEISNPKLPVVTPSTTPIIVEEYQKELTKYAGKGSCIVDFSITSSQNIKIATGNILIRQSENKTATSKTCISSNPQQPTLLLCLSQKIGNEPLSNAIIFSYIEKNQIVYVSPDLEIGLRNNKTLEIDAPIGNFNITSTNLNEIVMAFDAWNRLNYLLATLNEQESEDKATLVL